MTEPLMRSHMYRLGAVAFAAALSAGITIPSTLALSSGRTTSAAPGGHDALCVEFANATPGSPAAFRLAESLADLGVSC